MKAIVFFILLALPSVLIADDHTKFCNGIKDWPKKSPIQAPGASSEGLQESDLQKHFNTIAVSDALTKHMTKGFVFVDTRKAKDRKVGQIPFAINITANAKDTKKKGSANEFSKNTLLKKLNKLSEKAKKKGKLQDMGLKEEYKSVTDAKDINFIVFCNGRKCHRSSFGGCELLRLGIDKSKVHVMLDGYPGWLDANGPKS